MNSRGKSGLNKFVKGAGALCLLLCLVQADGFGAAEEEYAPRMVLAHYHTTVNPYFEGQSNEDRIKDEVRSAVKAGLDGFFINGFVAEKHEKSYAEIVKAARELGYENFKVGWSFDFNFNKKNPNSKFYGVIENPERLIRNLIKTHARDKEYLAINGKPVITTFSGPRGKKPQDWWKEKIIDPLRKEGVEVLVIPDIRLSNGNVPPTLENMRKMWKPWSPFVAGAYNFGAGHHYYPTPREMTFALENMAAALHETDGIFMSSYSPSFYSHCKSGNGYKESEGGRGTAAQWKSIIQRQKPELVIINTWNDIGEGSFIQPTQTKVPHFGYFELCRYFISWYHTLKEPEITRDMLFYFYRRTSRDAVVQGAGCPGPVTENTEDVIYLTTALTEPAEALVTMGGKKVSFQMEAGISHITVPFIYGKEKPLFEIVRDKKKIAEAAGPFPIVKTLYPDPVDADVYTGWTMEGGVTSDGWTPSRKDPEWFRE